MDSCACSSPHERRKIVITGGPGTGKTAVLELLRRSLCHHAAVLPESAGIVFGGGFPRSPERGPLCAAQWDNRGNPLRVESAAEAIAVDARIAEVWRHHPRYRTVEATPRFLVKARRVLDLLLDELPACCRVHVRSVLEHAM